MRSALIRVRRQAFNHLKTLTLRKSLHSDLKMEAFSSFYISLPDKPVYLKPRKDKKTTSLTGVETSERSVLARFGTLYLLGASQQFVGSSDKGDDNCREKSYVCSCLSAQSLFRHLIEEDFSSSFEFVLGARFCDNGHSTRRQLYALLADDAPPTADDALRLHAQKSNCEVWVYERDASAVDSTSLWRLRDRQTKETATQMPEVLEESDQPFQVSPIFQQRCFSPVFHDYERTIRVLDVYKECPEVQELRKIASKEFGEPQSLSQLQSLMKHPLVVVEGMDATGKTTLTQFLEGKLQAARYSTPPPCLLHLRRFFDKLPEIVRRAYYSLGNYIVAQQIATECQTRAVVMDRYWHSTAAYGIANETSYEDLPPPEHSVYCWPSDLLQPNAVVFLTVSEDVRRERLGNRSDSNITFEEKSLNKDQLFRKRLCEAYLRMQNPACLPVDASGSKEEVVETVLKQLELAGIQITEL